MIDILFGILLFAAGMAMVAILAGMAVSMWKDILK